MHIYWHKVPLVVLVLTRNCLASGQKYAKMKTQIDLKLLICTHLFNIFCFSRYFPFTFTHKHTVFTQFIFTYAFRWTVCFFNSTIWLSFYYFHPCYPSKWKVINWQPIPRQTYIYDHLSGQFDLFESHKLIDFNDTFHCFPLHDQVSLY